MDVDLDEIKGRLEEDISSRQMLELCHKRSKSKEPMVKFFDLSPKNKRMIHFLHNVRDSSLFMSLWRKCLQKADDLCKDDTAEGERLSMDKVQELAWTPSFRRWRDLWERVISGEISLQEVEERFSRFRDDAKSLEVEIETATACLSDEDIDTVLRNRIDQIKQCNKLTECSEAAETILEFKEAMFLEGDFQVLDEFRDQVNLGILCSLY